MILEGNLLEAAAILKPESLSYNLSEAIDPLSLLADFDLPDETVKLIADKVVASNSLDLSVTFDESTVFHLESLKQILCGFSVQFIEALIRSNFILSTISF